MRAKISVFEPLVRHFRLRSSLEDQEGTWYDFCYEKIPHFCFECCRLVHSHGVCEPPVELANQWGPWLRASPGRSGSSLKDSSSRGPTNSNIRGNSCMDDSDCGKKGKASVRDCLAKRNPNRDFTPLADSRTGGKVRSGHQEVSSPNKQKNRSSEGRGKDPRNSLEQKRENEMRQELKYKQELRRQELKYQYARNRFEDGRPGHWTAGGEQSNERFVHRERKRDMYIRKLRHEGRRDRMVE